MIERKNITFDAAAFLANAGLGRMVVQLKPKQAFFLEGNPADSIFYLQKGRATVTIVSKNGKEATITLLSAGDFFGEESLASDPQIGCGRLPFLDFSPGRPHPGRDRLR